MGRNYLCVPFEFFVQDAADLTNEEFGRLVRGMYRYFTSGEAITTEGNERFFAKSAMASQDNFRKKYEETSQKRREAGKAGASKRWQMLANDSKAKQTIANDSGLVLDIDIDNRASKDNIYNISNKEKEITKEKEKRKHFVPPTVQEVEAYIREQKYNVDAEAFVAYYESVGWKVGSKPMKSWKGAVVTWAKRDKAKEVEKTHGAVTGPFGADYPPDIFGGFIATLDD